MKSTSASIIVFSVAILLACLGCDEQVAFDPQSVEGRKIVLTEKTISFDGKKLDLPVTIDALVAELGEPDETHDLHNTIRVWNELGIYCYTKPESRKVDDISFGFLFRDFDFHPTKSFTGSVSIGAVHIHKGANTASLEASGITSDRRFPDLYKKEIGDIKIYIEVQDDKIASASFALPK